jgi:hypothetical protein
MVSRREVDAPGRAPADGSPAFVIRDRILNASRVKARIPSAKAEINVLEREKVRLIEEPGPFKDGAADQHHASADGIHDLHGAGFERRDAPAGGAMTHSRGPARKGNAG